MHDCWRDKHQGNCFCNRGGRIGFPRSKKPQDDKQGNDERNSSDNPVSPDELRKKLIEEGKEQGLNYVYIVRRLSNIISAFAGQSGFGALMGGSGASTAVRLPRVREGCTRRAGARCIFQKRQGKPTKNEPILENPLFEAKKP